VQCASARGRVDRACGRTVAAVCATALAWLPPAAAEEPRVEQAADGGVAIEMPTVEIVGERPAGSIRAPGAETTVIDAARFAGGLRSMAELVGTSPGVTLHALGGPGQATTLSVRGAAADQSLVLLDGIPLAGPGGGAVDLSTVPAALIERLVVSRGVLGAQAGAGALGGAVELVPRSFGGGLQGGAQLAAGSFGTAQAAFDVETEHWIAVIQLDRTRGDYEYQRKLTPELADAPYYAETRANADSRRAGALLRWSTRPSGASELSALLQGSTGERGLPGRVGGLTPRARADDASWVGGVRYQALAGEATWSARAWARGSWLRLRGLRFFGDCAEEEPGCDPTIGRSVAARGEAKLRSPLGRAHVLSASLAGGIDAASGDGVGQRRRAVASAALGDDVSLGRATLHPALRLDLAGQDLGVSPGITATLRPWPDGPLELRAGAGSSFRAPTFSELYLDQGALTPNPDLRPERALSIDAGIGWRAERIELHAGAFWSEYRDLILYELNPPARIKPFNVGRARIAGVEARALVTLPRGFFAEASYSHLDGRNLRPGEGQDQALPYRPPHRLYLRASHRGRRFEGYLEIDALSAMPRNSFGTAALPGRALFNAGAGVRALGPLWLDLEIKNLLDDRTQQDLFQYPLPGLSATAIARARL